MLGVQDAGVVVLKYSREEITMANKSLIFIVIAVLLIIGAIGFLNNYYKMKAHGSMFFTEEYLSEAGIFEAFFLSNAPYFAFIQIALGLCLLFFTIRKMVKS